MYDVLLEKTDVPSGHRQYYAKWLHFNLDFCRTFRVEAKEKHCIPISSHKPQSKSQPEWLRKQFLGRSRAGKAAVYRDVIICLAHGIDRPANRDCPAESRDTSRSVSGAIANSTPLDRRISPGLGAVAWSALAVVETCLLLQALMQRLGQILDGECGHSQDLGK